MKLLMIMTKLISKVSLKLSTGFLIITQTSFILELKKKHMYHFNAYMIQRLAILALGSSEKWIIGKAVLNGLAIKQFQIMLYVLGKHLRVNGKCKDVMMESQNGTIVATII
jgi:hypothetical protein